MATENGFVNRSAELNFILTKMDGGQRCDMLGIKEAHYEDESKARKWHDGLVSEMGNCSEKAKENLEDIYHIMVGLDRPSLASEGTLLSVGASGESSVQRIAVGKGGSAEERSPVSKWISST